MAQTAQVLKQAAERIVPAAATIQNLVVTNLAMQDAINAIDIAIHQKTPMRIAFINADCVNIAANNTAYKQALSEMDWVFPDGIGMRLAGQMLGEPIRDNVNGTDLFPRLCSELAHQKRRIYLLGAKPGVARSVADWAEHAFPGICIAGCRDGYFDPDRSHDVVAEIKRTSPDVLLVALGAPRQELWIQQHSQVCGAAITMGVGGLFDFYSGNIPRAPMWMRRLSLEWIYRLYQEPGRMWRRYLIGNWVFMARVFKERLQKRQKRVQS